MAGEGRLTPAELAAGVAARLPESPLVVALSGGADSAVLAWAVAESGSPARAVSVDHGLPGSPVLMEAAAAIARRLGLEHTVVAVEPRSGSETDLRAVRLDALESAAGPDEVIVTGHTRDDQTETVLGNILRGTGTPGLAGIPRSRARWHRPLLDVGRDETRAIAAELGLPFADDPQNDDETVRRNRLRSDTIPSLAAAFNPALVEALARLGDAAAADDELIEARAARVPIRRSPGAVLIPAAVLQTVPDAVAARVAARALREAAAPVDSAAIAAVIAAAGGNRTTVAGRVDVAREGPWVVLASGPPPIPDPVTVPAAGRVEWGDWHFEAADRLPVGRFAMSLPAEPRLLVRAPRPGDRISLGEGSKPVGEALAEAGVPTRERSHWPVLESDGTIVWIAGVRAAPAIAERRVTVRAVRRRS